MYTIDRFWSSKLCYPRPPLLTYTAAAAAPRTTQMQQQDCAGCQTVLDATMHRGGVLCIACGNAQLAADYAKRDACVGIAAVVIASNGTATPVELRDYVGLLSILIGGREENTMSLFHADSNYKHRFCVRPIYEARVNFDNFGVRGKNYYAAFVLRALGGFHESSEVHGSMLLVGPQGKSLLPDEVVHICKLVHRECAARNCRRVKEGKNAH